MNRYLCIGDIHACPAPLYELLETVDAADAGEYRLVFLGDYLDRGPDANAVIDCMRMRDAIYLMGNHEEMLFMALDSLVDVRDEQGRARRREFLAAKTVSEENVAWLRANLVVTYEDENFVFSHAGLNPTKSMQEQSDDDYLWSWHTGDYSGVTSKTVVHGHTSVPEVTIEGNNVNVDTGCGKGGLLSAILLPDMVVFQSKSRGERMDGGRSF